MAEVEEIVDPAIVDVEFEARDVAQCRNFGSKSEAASLFRDEQRLDPKGVASKRQGPCVAVPDRRGIHTFEAQPGVLPPAQVSGQQSLDVAASAEVVARLELAAQVEMIDDLAVADDRITPVGAGNRLVPMFDIDDAEAAHPKAEIAVHQAAGVVRSAVNQLSALSRNYSCSDRAA